MKRVVHCVGTIVSQKLTRHVSSCCRYYNYLECYLNCGRYLVTFKPMQ